MTYQVMLSKCDSTLLVEKKKKKKKSQSQSLSRKINHPNK